MSYIWHLKRLGDGADYDEVREMVVIAKTDLQARVVAGHSHGDEGLATWHSPVLVECVCIGDSNEEYDDGVVCRDKIES